RAGDRLLPGPRRGSDRQEGSCQRPPGDGWRRSRGPHLYPAVCPPGGCQRHYRHHQSPAPEGQRKFCELRHKILRHPSAGGKSADFFSRLAIIGDFLITPALVSYPMRTLAIALLCSLFSVSLSLQALTFRLTGDEVVGDNLVIKTKYEDTFVELGHIYGLGFRELIQANPDVLPWVPGEGTEVTLPLSFIVPVETREAIVLNLAEFRVYH